jgi:hypothetical protein
MLQVVPNRKRLRASSQVPPRNRGTETSVVRLRDDVVIGNSDNDEDYDEEGEALFSDFDGAEVFLPHNGSLISIH